ncbi:nucleolar protein 10 [Cimex lectularius]|uniref:Nucleolar protein 10 n=1 Tax=Cimex lectularius TaxID=79782 RepID=A0A8I6TJ06_CIMLE|nr:nucleolar protein 10 [Cimex lectularius]
MNVTDPNNIKIYNLSSGKSLPEWLSDRKKRALVKKDVDIRKRIELLQDFTMPDLSNTVKVSKDGQYIIATGIYKPRVRCFEVHNLSMKFERCMDAEIVTFEILSDDYTKMVFLQTDRFIELHAAGGTYYRLRIPKFGRDMKYHYPSCDLYVTAAGPDIYRLNLERGQFLNSLTTEASEVNRIVINPVHQLVTVGTRDGKIEAWDPRQRKRCGVLDVAFSCVTDDTQVDGFPSVTSLEYTGPVTLGVGTATGQILIYDIRSDKPCLVKDHMYGYAIRDLAFHDNYVLSLDSAVLKIWDKSSGKIFTSIESGQETLFNNLCHVPNSGLIFMANESPKIQSYYIPQLGPAPKWCSFLDNLTEELEESKVDSVYDDFKFVTKKELEELQLTHLIGSPMLRAYMHGYFMNIRLYNKAKALVQPFSYEEYKKKRIREKIEKDRGTRIQIQNLPKVNRDLALKLMDQKREDTRRKAKNTPNILNDDRFKAMFENPDFQIDTNTEEYRLINPVVSRLDITRRKELKKELLKQQFDPVDEEPEGKPSDDDEIWSSDDEKEWVQEVKKQHKAIAKEKKEAELNEEKQQDELNKKGRSIKLYQLKEGSSFKRNIRDFISEDSKLALGERIKEEERGNIKVLSSGNREMTFRVDKKKKKGMTDPETMRKHREERKQLIRRAPNTFRMSFKKFGKKR